MILGNKRTILRSNHVELEPQQSQRSWKSPAQLWNRYPLHVKSVPTACEIVQSFLPLQITDPNPFTRRACNLPMRRLIIDSFPNMYQIRYFPAWVSSPTSSSTVSSRASSSPSTSSSPNSLMSSIAETSILLQRWEGFSCTEDTPWLEPERCRIFVPEISYCDLEMALAAEKRWAEGSGFMFHGLGSGKTEFSGFKMKGQFGPFK